MNPSEPTPPATPPGESAAVPPTPSSPIEPLATGLPVELTGLVFACPFTAETPTCPFHEVRLDEPVERVRWLRALPDDAKASLASHHAGCCRERLKR